MITFLDDGAAWPTDTRSEADIKESIRARDGRKCCECGMTRETHCAEYGSNLEVHRLVPGSSYHPSACVTLCVPCHRKKPSRRSGDLLWQGDVAFIGFNLFDSADSDVYWLLEKESLATGVPISELVLGILRDHVSPCATRQLAFALATDGPDGE